MPEADWVARTLAENGTTVVSVNYRLAPIPADWAALSGQQPGEGYRYPAPSDDILTAWSWTLGNANRVGIDAGRLAIGGASAGANLVTGAVLRMHQPETRPRRW